MNCLRRTALLALGVALLLGSPWAAAQEGQAAAAGGQQPPPGTGTPPEPAGTEQPAATAAGAPPAEEEEVPAGIQFFTRNEIEGFLSLSWFYNFNRPKSDLNTGRAFDNEHNDFNVNKFKLVFKNPIEVNGDKWDAGYRADLILGNDATLLQSRGLVLGGDADLEQAFITFNVPVGNGLQLSAGKWATLQGVEVIEEVDNPNWSVGNQFLFVESFTGTGIEAAYAFSSVFGAQLRLENGWDVVDDNNDAKSLMGRLNIGPFDATTIYVVGYGGPEQFEASTALGGEGADAEHDWRTGVEVIVKQGFTDKLTGWVQADYGHESDVDVAPIDGAEVDAQWWAFGLWLLYNMTDKVGFAVRGDYLNDQDGARTSAAPFTAPFPENTGQELFSLTFTFNYTPVPNLQIRPEFRFDYSTLDDAFDNNDVQVTVGMGMAYRF
jgi:hypothetical protein